MDERDDFADQEPLEEMFSLDDLSAAYARAIAESDEMETTRDGGIASKRTSTEPSRAGGAGHASILGDESQESEEGVNPQMIIEAALFVGHPENRPVTSAMIAKTMRGVSSVEVEQLIEKLNEGYRQSANAIEIYREGDGYRMGVRESMRTVKSAFYGKVRETRLNQPAIDVLSLVAYQPGITLATINEQRGKESGPIVNQLVRRELLEVKRHLSSGSSSSAASSKGPRSPALYFPTVRLLNLLGIESLEDLPMVDDTDVSPLT